MKKTNVYKLPLAPNICEQHLREIQKTDSWSIAQVGMNPGAFSLLHKHEKMDEIYIVTRGFGKLTVGDPSLKRGYQVNVMAGSILIISAGKEHQLFNTGPIRLEHLVLAKPAFDPKDIYLIDKSECICDMFFSGKLPEFEDCFDGAKIMVS